MLHVMNDTFFMDTHTHVQIKIQYNYCFKVHNGFSIVPFSTVLFYFVVKK